jgi:hypothetical protein
MKPTATTPFAPMTDTPPREQLDDRSTAHPDTWRPDRHVIARRQKA